MWPKYSSPSPAATKYRSCIGAALITIFAHAPSVCAQSAIEVAPFGGYLFGNDLFEAAVGRPLDVDGASAIGLVFDVPLHSGLQFEGFVTHQDVDVVLQPGPFSLPAHTRIAVDQWQAGALQEFAADDFLRPFLTGMFGLGRYAVDGDTEIRFSLAAGGGVKIFPVRHVGVRLDGRVFATFIDAAASAGICGSAGCILGLHLNVVWQAQFAAGLVVKFP